MAEYIEREALLKEVRRIGGHPWSDWETVGVERVIMRQTAADVAPVVHGRWVGGYHTHKGQWVYTKPCCSSCSFEQAGISNFCPNCGARMDGE